MTTGLNLTSVFNIPDIEEDVDYKRLFEKEKRTRIFFQKKARELESKLTKYMKENKHMLGRNKKQDIHNIIEEIKSFKLLLPNSVKQIDIDSSNSIDEDINALIKEFAVYGIPDQTILTATPQDKHQGSTLFSNDNFSQILEHSSKLVFPSGTGIRHYSGKEALEKSMEIINISKQKLKSFILTFEPTSFQKQVGNSGAEEERECVINLLNPERRVYAVTMMVEEFTVVEGCTGGRAEGRVEKKKSVKFKDVESAKEGELKIAVTQRAYTIFSYYPFFNFFEELLRSLLYSAKVERYIKYKEGGENLRLIDSAAHGTMVSDMLGELRREGNQKAIRLDTLIDFSLGPNNKIFLELSREACLSYLAEDWAYPVLSLFNLDIFLEVLTLLILEEKMVFVCEDKTILTYAIFLFSKVLMRPFEYPYPIVNLIPDQEEYLNAPFPIVYGYNKSREEILSLKLHKKYKNTYVFFEPTGVEIMCEESKKKLLNSKSPKLRDKLLPKFKKMQRNYPNPSLSFLSFISKKEIVEYSYANNYLLSKEIIGEVYSYMHNDIFKLLPSEPEVQEIRAELVGSQVDEDELNQLIFKRIKERYSGKSRDPFFQAFLETQLLNVHIFKY